MASQIKSILKDWCPPALARFLRGKHRQAQHHEKTFKGPYVTWRDAQSASRGYDSNVILEKVRHATLQVLAGSAAYERDSVLFDRVQYSWPVAAGLLWAASKNNGHLNVLDYGGSLGTRYFENRQLLNRLPHLSWGIVEQRNFVDCGKANIDAPNLRFFHTIEECADSSCPNVILLSSVLQYLEDFKSIIGQLARLGPDTIIVDRTIINDQKNDLIYVQSVPEEIYQASYPVFSISECHLIEVFDKHGYELISDFESLPFPALRDINSQFKGYLFGLRASDH